MPWLRNIISTISLVTMVHCFNTTIIFTGDRDGPPFETSNDPPLLLKTDVYIEDVNSFSAINMDFRVDYFLYHEWTVKGPTCEKYREHDEQLSEDTMNYSGQVLINSVNHSRFWIPDSFLSNAKVVDSPNKTLKLMKLKMTKVNSTCDMVFSARRYAIVSCQMAFDIHPFDTQHCPMSFRSYEYNKTLITYSWINENATPLNPELKLLRHSLTALKKHTSIDMLGETYSSIDVLFLFERHLAHYVMQVFAPSSFIVVISWFSFWLGYENTSVTDRITLSITGLLTLVTQFAGFRTELPPASYITGIDIWMSTCLIFIFIVILETVMGSVLNRRWKDDAPKMIPFPPATTEDMFEHRNHMDSDPYIENLQNLHRKPFNTRKEHTPNVFQVPTPQKSERRHTPGAAVLIMYPKSNGPIQQLTYFLGQTILDSTKNPATYVGVTQNPAEKLDTYCRFIVPSLFAIFVGAFFVHYVIYR